MANLFTELFGFCDHDWSKWENYETLEYTTGTRELIQKKICKTCGKVKFRKECI